MNYYEKFKPEADVRAKSYFKIVSDLKAQLPKVRKRLAEEKTNRDKFKDRLAKLQDISVESLAGSQGDYDKYKTSIKKLNNDLQVSQEIIDNITTNILPNAEIKLRESETNLRITLNQLVLESRKDADAVINEFLRSIINEHQEFLDAFDRIFKNYDLIFIASDESYCPGPWPAGELRELGIRLGIGTLDETPEIKPFEPPIPAVPIAEPFGTPELEAEATAAATSDDLESGGE